MPYVYVRSCRVGTLIGQGGITIRRLRRDQGIDIRAPRYHPEIVEKLARNRANWTSIWAEEITDSLVREIEDLVGFQNLRESCPHLHHISEISKPDGFLADARRIEELEHLLAKSELRNDQLQSENKHLRSVINAKAGTPMLIGDDDEVEDGEVQSLEQGMKGVKRDAEVGLIEGSTHLTDHNRGMARDEMRTSSTAMRRYVHEHIKQEMEDGRENFALEYELDDHEVKRRFKMDFESELLDHGDF